MPHECMTVVNSFSILGEGEKYETIYNISIISTWATHHKAYDDLEKNIITHVKTVYNILLKTYFCNNR